MIITKTRLEIGLEKPFRALHMSDNHIALADNRDDERKIKLAESRTAAFNHGKPGNVAMEEYALQLDYARSHRLPEFSPFELKSAVSGGVQMQFCKGGRPPARWGSLPLILIGFRWSRGRRDRRP